MDAQIKRTKAEEGLIAQFETGLETLPGEDWVRKLRQQAFDSFMARGLPHRRVEEWKYTDLRGALKEAFIPAIEGEADRSAIDAALGPELAALDAVRLVILDGQFDDALSDKDDLKGKAEVLPLSQGLSDAPPWLKDTLGQVNPQAEESVIALNAALMTGGIALRIEDGAEFEKPVHLIHIATGKHAMSVTTRNVVSVGKKSKVTLLESYISAGDQAVQRNVVTELVAADGSEIDHIKFQNENGETTHLTSWLTQLAKDVVYRGFQFSLGGALSRNQIFVRFAGEGSTSHVSGAVMARGRQHNDTTLVIDHAVPACESREFNKLVLDDSSRGIVQCKVNVHKDAQKSDGHQMAQALLLSDGAEFDSKPELEIFADDVVCGHGSTSGQVDEELLFYLRSRGIPEDKARALLITAFVGEALEKIENSTIREAFLALAEARLSGERT